MTWCPHNTSDLRIVVVRAQDGVHYAQSQCSECESLLGARESLTKLIAVACEVDDLAEALLLCMPPEEEE